MRASLDTNVIIHLYRAGLQGILFDIFDEGVFIYGQIRSMELEHHGQDVLSSVDADIDSGKIELFTDQKLKDLAVYKVFENNVRENRILYSGGDLGEVYAISLAQTIGAYSLVTDDTKQGGPYMSLLQLDYDIMPFTFADVLILRYLMGVVDAQQTVQDFELVNNQSQLNWSFRSQISKFIKRFFKEPYREEERQWIQRLAVKYEISIKQKLSVLSKLV
ncbi:MAG: hypothetical protein LIP11_15290 [Clostridiales bacterium]|nr:hypothetical protein [Clostridiales bacterium]